MDLKWRYLKADLDFDRFAIISILPQDEEWAVIILHSRYPADDPTPWCVQYKGNGHYYATADEMFAYCDSRGWKMEL